MINGLESCLLMRTVVLVMPPIDTLEHMEQKPLLVRVMLSPNLFHRNTCFFPQHLLICTKALQAHGVILTGLGPETMSLGSHLTGHFLFVNLGLMKIWTFR